MSHVCIAGDGMAAWSSVMVPVPIGAHVVFIIEFVVMLAPLVLAFEFVVDDVDVEAEFCWSMIILLGIFSIFGIINGVGGTWLPAIAWFIDAGTSVGFNDGGRIPDVDGKWSAFPILPNTSWYVRNWLMSSMLTCTIWPSALRTSNICGVWIFVSDRICALPPGCDGKW